MSQDLYTLSLDSIKYVLGLISATVDLPNTILDDLNIQTTTTYSSYRLDTLLKALKDENIKYCDEAIAGLNKLSKEIVDDSSKVVKENTIYLILTNPVNNVYEQWLLINGTPQMIGTTEMNLDSVYTKDEADARYTLITDFDALKTEVDKKVEKTNIITAKDNSATDDQVYSAKAINTELTNHTDDTDIHVTTADKTKWDKVTDKVDTTDLDSLKTEINTLKAEINTLKTALDKKADTDKVAKKIYIRDTSSSDAKTLIQNHWSEFDNFEFYNLRIDTSQWAWNAEIYTHTQQYGTVLLRSYGSDMPNVFYGKIFNGVWTWTAIANE